MSIVKIPIGPQHPLLKEPLSVIIGVSGEKVIEASLRIGYVHRGIERLCEQRTYVQDVHIVERVCGICSHIHTMTFCQAVESLIGLDLPQRAAYIRMLLCELERIHSHLLWLGILADGIGFSTIFMYSWRDRELIMDLMENLSGGRVSHGVNLIGGVRIDVTAQQTADILEKLDIFEKQSAVFLSLIEQDRSFQMRTQSIGTLDLQTVRSFCAVGPMARASGEDVDIRRDVPYAAYRDLEWKVIVDTGGDVWTRAHVRVLEIRESLRLCRDIVKNLPAGSVSVTAPRRVPEGEVVMRTEAPRGELLYYVRSDGSDHPARIKIRTPTLPALLLMSRLLPGIQMADVSAIIASADLCIACADR
ncbi:MAG: hydrogenase large subunit [Anaerolineae bacterium]